MTAQPVAEMPPATGLAELLSDSAFRITVLSTSRDPNAKLTALLRPVDARRSALVVKIPTTALAAAAVAHEARVLAELHSLTSSVISTTVPHVVEMMATRQGDALVVTLAPGRPMTNGYHRWRHTRSPVSVAQDLGAVAAWLRALQTQTVSGTAPVEMDAGVTDLILSRFAHEPGVDRTVDAVRAACARLREHDAPRTVVHGDLWCGNVLVADGSVTGVVDWEEGRLAGEPIRDIVRFALTYALYLDRHTRHGHKVVGHPGLRATEWGAGITYLVDGDGWVCDLLRAFVRVSMSRLGVPGGLWRDALLAGIAEVAARADDTDFARAHLTVLARVAAPRGALKARGSLR